VLTIRTTFINVITTLFATNKQRKVTNKKNADEHMKQLKKTNKQREKK
jgi:hypothetical protein